MIVADKLATKYQEYLVNVYNIDNSDRSWEDSNMYSLLTAKIKEISKTLNKIQ